MPFQHRAIPAHRTGIVRFDEVVAGTDLVEALRELVADPGWRSVVRVVWDCRPIRELVLTEADLRAVLAEIERFRSRLRSGRSAVISRGETDEIVARLLWQRSHPHAGRELRVFDTAREAAAWLEVPEDLLDTG